jgi:hypothetical protein
MKKSNMSRVFGQNVEEAGGMVIFLLYLHGNELFCAPLSSFRLLARMEFLNTFHNTLISPATSLYIKHKVLVENSFLNVSYVALSTMYALRVLLNAV